MSDITCFHPMCQEPAHRHAYDEMFNINVAFCHDHIHEWIDVDHIDFSRA